MLVYVTANATNHPQVNWVSEYPHAPFTDYSSYGTLPHTSLLGSFSLVRLSDNLLDGIWEAGRRDRTTTVYPKLGLDQQVTHWSREVDSVTSIILTLGDENLSTSWVRVNDTDIAPRRQI